MERHHREPLARWQLALGPPAQDRRRRSRGRCEASRPPTLNRSKYTFSIVLVSGIPRKRLPDTSESRKLLRSDNASAKIGFVTAKDEPLKCWKKPAAHINQDCRFSLRDFLLSNYSNMIEPDICLKTARESKRTTILN